MNVNLSIPIFVINDFKMIYSINSYNELSSRDICHEFNLDLVAGFDYINPDESDRQGFVSKENFSDHVQHESVIVYQLVENIKERLREEGYQEINIADYQIYPSIFKSEEA